jgi:PAS domain-containing protein
MSATKQNNSPTQGISLRDRKSEPARCAFSESGEIVFASDSFYDLVGLTNEGVKNGASLYDVFYLRG